MSSEAFEALIARLVAAGALYLRSGSVHVDAEAWHALTRAEQRALVARRDAIREQLHRDATADHGLCSRRSRAQQPNDNGAILPARDGRVAAVSPDIEDSASRDGSSTASERDGSTGHESAIEQGVEAADAVEGAVTARGDSGGGGDVATSDRPSAGNVATPRMENQRIDSVSRAKVARRVATRPTENSHDVSTTGYGSGYQRQGRAIVDTESFAWFSRKCHRSNDRVLEQIRRDEERDFGRLGEMYEVVVSGGWCRWR